MDYHTSYFAISLHFKNKFIQSEREVIVFVRSLRIWGVISLLKNIYKLRHPYTTGGSGDKLFSSPPPTPPYLQALYNQQVIF